MRDRHDLDEVEKKTKTILEKYKNQPTVYKKLKRAIDSFRSYSSINRNLHKELADLTSKINFRCNFKDGKCAVGRSKMCCCSNCKAYFGHHNHRFYIGRDSVEYIEEELLYYTKKYSMKTGFWREDKGCILPRGRRSITCLVYNCSSGKLTKEEILLLEILRNGHQPQPSYIKKLIRILKDYFLYRET